MKSFKRSLSKFRRLSQRLGGSRSNTVTSDTIIRNPGSPTQTTEGDGLGSIPHLGNGALTPINEPSSLTSAVEETPCCDEPDSNSTGSLQPTKVNSDVHDVDEPVVKNGTSTVFSVAKSSVGLVKEVSAAFPPLHSVAGGLLFILEHHETWVTNKEDVKRLAKRVYALHSMLESRGNVENTQNFHVLILLRELRKTADALDGLQGKGRIQSYISAASDKECFSSLVEDVRNAIMDYQTAVQSEILSEALKLVESNDDRVLQALMHARDASHRSEHHSLCLSGTRTGILHEIDAWADDPSSLPVYWLNGHAGSGKSTIAQSFCRRAFADGQLGASFFCSREYANRRDLHMIFPTIAFQLAYRYSAFRTHVVKTLTRRPDIAQESLQNQLTELLVEPLKVTGIATIIVIDALDECNEDQDNQPASTILSLLARHIISIPGVKFFVTGRPETRIRTGFRLPTLKPLTTIFVLHSVENSMVNDDISRFLKVRLLEVVRGRSDFDVSVPWPSEADICVLTEKSAGLFIFAATAISYISSPFDQPRERLAILVETPETNIGIDQLYLTVLENGSSGKGKPTEMQQTSLRKIITIIALASHPLSCTVIADLLELEPTKVATILRPFHAIMHVPRDSEESIRIYHKSFADFIVDPARCTNPAFCIDMDRFVIVERCLETMFKGLRKNICSLPRYAMNSAMELAERRKLIGGALEYSCRFWVDHFVWALCSEYSTQITKAISRVPHFLVEKQILWFEVLSLVEDLDVAIYSLPRLLKILRSGKDLFSLDPEDLGKVEEFEKWLKEGLGFIQGFRSCVQQSAAHLYHSALPFAHRYPRLQNLHAEDLKVEAKVENTCLVWPITILNGRRRVTRVKFSIRGGTFVVIDGTIQIFSRLTGDRLQTFRSQGNVHSADFSPDDAYLASAGHDCPVEIWDMQTGGVVRSLSVPPLSCAQRLDDRLDVHVQYSPSGEWIAWGGWMFIRIWNSSTGTLHHSYESQTTRLIGMSWVAEDLMNFAVHTYPRDQATWNVNGYRSTVELWNILDKTHQLVHNEPVNSLAVSHLHSIIACAAPTLLTLYDLKSSKFMGTVTSGWAPSVEHWEAPVTFAPTTVRPTFFWDNQVFEIGDGLEDVRLVSLRFMTTAWTTVAFSPGSPDIAIATDTVTRLWSFKEDRLDPYSSGWNNAGYLGSELYVTPDGNDLLFLSPTEVAKAWVEHPNGSKNTFRIQHLLPGKNRDEAIIPISNIAMSPDGTSCSLFCACDPMPSETRYTYDAGFTDAVKYSATVLGLPISDLAQVTELAQRLRPRCPGPHTVIHYLNEITAVILSTHTIQDTNSRGIKDEFRVMTKVELVDAVTGEILHHDSPATPTDFGTWLQEPLHRDFRREDYWIEADPTGSVLRIHNRHGAEGHWKLCHKGTCQLAESASAVGEAGDLPVFVTENSIENGLHDHLSTVAQYPVITSGRNWIYNNNGERILWIPQSAETSYDLERSWRWHGKSRRLYIGGDSQAGTWFIVDFSNVNVEIPTAAYTYEKLGLKTITLSGLDRKNPVSATESTRKKRLVKIPKITSKPDQVLTLLPLDARYGDTELLIEYVPQLRAEQREVWTAQGTFYV